MQTTHERGSPEGFPPAQHSFLTTASSLATGLMACHLLANFFRDPWQELYCQQCNRTRKGS